MRERNSLREKIRKIFNIAYSILIIEAMSDNFRNKWLEISKEVLALIDDSITPRMERIVRRKVSFEVFKRLSEKLHILADEIAEDYLREVADNAILIDHVSEKILREEEQPVAIILINALDGSQNGVRGIAFYGGSIAIARYKPSATLEDLEVAVVRNFATNDVYTATRGGGAFLNNMRIRPSAETELANSIVGMDTYVENLADLIKKVEKLLSRVRDLRRMGCSSLEVCEVARGAIDSFIDLRGTTDIVHLASKLIVEEAGGVITDEYGNPLKNQLKVGERVKFIASGNRIIHEKILSLILATK